MGKSKRSQGSDDPTTVPQPDGGWSHGLRSVPQALVATSTSIEMVQPVGVFDAEGAYVHEAVLWRGRTLMVPPDPVPEPTGHLPGRWLWGGVLLNHFGHFLVETTGRLWGLDAVEGKLDGIVFLSKRDVEEEGAEHELSAFHQTFFNHLQIDLPVRVITAPTVVERLEVPGQGFGIGALAKGTPAFRRFFHERFAKTVAAEGPERLYISRSGLSAVRGGVLEEDRIETLLGENGYEVFHPQKHPLEVQIARYKAARQVVALDGSALHLFAMVAGPEARVAMVRRRDSGASDSIAAHIAAFTGTKPEVIDVIKQDWIRSDRKRADRTSIGELDFAALSVELVAKGFLPEGAHLPNLTPKQAQKAILQAERDLRKRSLTFRPVPRGVDPATVPLPERALKSREEQRAERKAQKAERMANPRNERQAARLAGKSQASA